MRVIMVTEFFCFFASKRQVDSITDIDDVLETSNKVLSFILSFVSRSYDVYEGLSIGAGFGLSLKLRTFTCYNYCNS